METKGKLKWEHGNKSIFKEIGNTKIEEILLGNTGTQGKFCWEHGNMDPPWEALKFQNHDNLSFSKIWNRQETVIYFYLPETNAFFFISFSPV